MSDLKKYLENLPGEVLTISLNFPLVAFSNEQKAEYLKKIYLKSNPVKKNMQHYYIKKEDLLSILDGETKESKTKEVKKPKK